jgi:cell division protein FtsB
MRRPGRAFLWILTIGVVAILVVIGLYLYREDKVAQGQLRSEIAIAQQTIQELRATDTSALEAEIAQLEQNSRSAQSRVSSLERILRDYTHSIEIEESLFEAALSTNVTIVQILERPSEPVEREGILLERLPVIVSAESAVPPSLVNFSIEVTNTLQSAYIERTTIKAPEPLDEEDEETEQVSSIELELSVYYLGQE